MPKFPNMISYFLRKNRIRPLLVILCLCWLVLISLYLYKTHEEWHKSDLLLVPDILTDGIRPVENGKDIFLIETDYTFGRARTVYKKIVSLTPRQACAIESVARHNPSSIVFVLFMSPTYYHDADKKNIMQTIIKYPNVQLRNVDLWSYTKDTPIFDWLKTGKFFSSSDLLATHASYLLRFVTLWRYGGTYTSLGSVLVKSLEDLPSNYALARTNALVSVDIMKFSHNSIGRSIAESCLKDFQRNFNSSNSINNGPGVLTRVLRRICNASENITDTNSGTVTGNGNGTRTGTTIDLAHCEVFKVFEKSKFYFKNEQYSIRTKKSKKFIKQTGYIANVWNEYSSNRKDRNIYSVLAKRNCPRVFAAAEDYF